MTSEHDDAEFARFKRLLRLDPWLREVHVSMDYWLRSQIAADKVRELLHAPTVRPDSTEATAVNALEDELRGILNVLTRPTGYEDDVNRPGDPR